MSRSVEQFFRREALAFVVFSVIAVTLACLPVSAQHTTMKQSEASEPPQGKSFASPEAAAAALYAAARKNDEDELLVILGPDAKDIVRWNNDPAVRKARREQFVQKYDQMHRLVKEPDDTVALYVGSENWPVPIPLVEYKGAWYFDAELGKQEILYRRIGRNEVEALEVCHVLVDAEKEYFSSAHEYTAKFVSTKGTHDGLYWNDSAKSPIGVYLAHASVDESGGENGEPFYGYYYRIVAFQGPSAAGGAEHGKMSGGFAIVAFPAEYRSSGVMTFLINQNGDAYEKDLGPTTDRLARQISAFNPDSTWKKVE
jgi:hypothetical protein